MAHRLVLAILKVVARNCYINVNWPLKNGYVLDRPPLSGCQDRI